MVASQKMNHENNNRIKFQRKRGRIKKDKSDIISLYITNDHPSTVHSKYFQHNITRKIKTYFHNFRIAFINIESKKENQRLSFFRK